MEAVILAAGESKRLRPLTNDIPKCLLTFGKTTLLARYLTILEQAKVEKTVIVTGFNAKAVEQEAIATVKNMSVEFVFNNDFASTTPLEGLLLVEPIINHDILLLNSDIYFPSEAIEALISHQASCVAIDSKSEFLSDEMFVNFDENDHVNEISKQLKPRETNQGKSLQIVKLIKEDARLVFKRAREISTEAEVQYPAQAYDVLIERNSFFALDLPGKYSQELDTIEDYHLLQKHTNSNDSTYA